MEYLAAGISMRQITAEANIHRNTIGHWRRNNPAFARALAHAQYERVLSWREAAEEHADLAIRTIAELLTNPKTPPSVRLRAALAMLQHATTLPPPEPATPIVQTPPLENLHNSAQPPASPEPAKSPAETRSSNFSRPRRSPYVRVGKKEQD